MSLIPFALVAFLLFYAQGLLARITLWTPDLAPILAAYAGLFLRRDVLPGCALLLAVLRGALDSEPIGVLILLHLGLCFVASVVRDVVYVDRLSTQLVVSFACAALYVAARWSGESRTESRARCSTIRIPAMSICRSP